MVIISILVVLVAIVGLNGYLLYAQRDHAERLVALHDKMDALQVGHVKQLIHAGRRIECPTCHTTYTYDHMGIKKTSPNDKAIVQCLCGALIRITFDAEGLALCQV